jgi:CheY-like chemotaxis protein/CheY-specific phosphatase CheX
VVDDEPDLRELMISQLGSRISGVDFFEAENGADALQKIRRQKFAVVVTDMAMPKLDGAGLIASLPAVPQDFQPDSVIVLSGHIDVDHPPQAIADLVYLTKPWEPDVLAKSVSRALVAVARTTGASVPDAPQVEVSFVNPIVGQLLFEINRRWSLQAERTGLALRSQRHQSGSFSVIVDIHGGIYVGGFSVSFDPVFLGKIGKNLEIHRRVVGEFAQTLARRCLDELNQKGYAISHENPVLLWGEEHSVCHKIRGRALVVDFAVKTGGSVRLEILVHTKA